MIILHSLYLYVSFKLENFLNVTMSGGRGICLIYNKFRNKLCLKKRVRVRVISTYYLLNTWYTETCKYTYIMKCGLHFCHLRDITHTDFLIS